MKAWTTNGNSTSDVIETEIDCTPIILPGAVVSITGITEGYGKTYTFSASNDDVLLKPEITFSYVFTGKSGKKTEGTGANITVSEEGSITITTVAKGYQSATTEIENNTFYALKKQWDFARMTDEEITTAGFPEYEILNSNSSSGFDQWTGRKRLYYYNSGNKIYPFGFVSSSSSNVLYHSTIAASDNTEGNELFPGIIVYAGHNVRYMKHIGMVNDETIGGNYKNIDVLGLDEKDIVSVNTISGYGSNSNHPECASDEEFYAQLAGENTFYNASEGNIDSETGKYTVSCPVYRIDTAATNVTVFSEVDLNADLSYFIQYVNENDGTIIKEVEGTGKFGDIISITEDQTSEFEFDGMNYVVESNDAEGKTVTLAGTIITITCYAVADYTLNYVDGEEIIKSETKTGKIGSTIEITKEETASFKKDGITYIYDGFEPENPTIGADGKTVVTLNFHKMSEVNYTVKFIDQYENEIKDAEIRIGDAGNDIAISDEDKEDIILNGKTYRYVSFSSDDETYAYDGSTVVTILYHLPEIGDEYTIVDQTFAGDPELKGTDTYKWGADIQGMIVTDKETDDRKFSGVYVTNYNDAKNNYSNKDFLTFTNVIGGTNQELNIAYKLYSPKDKGQGNTYYDINYFNADGDFVFGIQEASGLWAYTANIITANEDGTTKVTPISAHMSKYAGETVNINVKFTGTTAIIEIDGGTYTAYTKELGIKSIKLSISGVGGEDRDMNIENFIVKTIEAEETQFANYTLDYVVNGNSIKTETKSGIVGKTISLLDSDIENFFNEDETVKYIYVSNDAEGKTVASDGSAVVTITCREAATWNYTVKNNVNSEEIKGTVFEGEEATVAYHRYILNDGKVYIKNPGKDTPHKYTFTPAEDGEEKTLEYTEYADNGIFFTEGEDIEGMTETTKGNADVRSSNGLSGYSSESVNVCTLKPGKYIVRIAASGDKDKKLTVKHGEEELFTATTNGSWSEFSSEEFTVEADTELSFEGAAQSYPLDYILIMGTEFGEATGIEITDKEGQKIETLELVSGEEYQLGAAITPEHVSDDTVNWSSADETVATVDENGKVTAVANGKKTTITATCGNVSASIVVKSHAQVGDAKMDGKVEISDAVDIANYVVGKKTVAEEDREFYVKAANANGDEEGLITFADASATVKIALDATASASTQSRIRADYDESADALVIGRASAGSRGTVIPVSLENAGAYVAFQADIILPEGMDVEVKGADAVAATHTLMTKKHADNHIRVALFNFGGNTFAAGEAPVIEIVTDSFVSASDIVISDIIASDADANASVLASKTAATNGVAAIGLDEDAPVKVYDINGIYVSDTMEGLQQGTYIVRQGETAKTVRIR